MQTTLLSLAIAVILALLAALLGPYFIDWNSHRAAFEQQASQAVGLPVRVTGPMDVRLLPSPSLVLSGVEIGKPGDPQALRAKALAIEFALPPLFSGKLRAVEMRLIGPEITLALAADGHALFPAALAGINADVFSIDKLAVEDARVDVSDAGSGARATLSKLWFNGDVRGLPGPIRGEGAFVMDGALYAYRVSTGRPETGGSRVRVSVDPADRPLTAEIDGFFTADGGVPRFEGVTTIARRVAAGKGDKIGKGDLLGKGDLAAEEPWRVTARVKAGAAAALFEQLEFQYGPDDRALKLAGTAEATFGAQPRLNVVVSARQLDADKLLAATGGANLPPRAAIAAVLSAAGDIAPPSIPTQIGFGVDAITLGGGTLQNVRGDIEIGRGTTTLSGFEARAPGFTQWQASGQIAGDGERLSFTGPVDVTSADPRAFADWLEGRSMAALPMRPARVRGELTLGNGTIAVDRLRAELDRKTFDGSFSYAFAAEGERSRLDLRLRADEIDLDALMQFAGSARAVSDLERPDDVALALSLGRLRLAGIDAGKADLRLKLDAAGLTVERIAIGDLAGLSIDSKGHIDWQAKEPRGSLSFNLGMRDPSVMASLAAGLAPGWIGSLERAAAVMAPAKLAGTITVEPSGKAGISRANLAVGGPLGRLHLNLKTSVTGQWVDIGQADFGLEASLDAADVNALVTLAAADRFVSVPRQPGTYTISLNGQRDGEMRLDTRIVSAALDARATGTIRPFASDGKSSALDIAIGKADITVGRKTVPVSLRTGLKTDAFGARLDNLSATIAGAGLRGRVGVAFGDVPSIDGELKTDTIDIGAILAAATGLDPAKKAPNERWAETPFALSAVPAFGGELKLDAASAVLSPSLTASDLRSVLRFSPMQVKAEGAEANLLGGRMTADVTLRRGADGIGVQGHVALKNADVVPLLFAEASAPLRGRAALDVQFEGAGLSPRALIGSLSGSGMLTLDKPRFAALDPKAFAAAMRSVDQGLPLDMPRIREVVGRALEAGPLAVNSADASLAIAGGIARIETFTASSDAADIAVTGSYNLADARIDTRLALSGAVVSGALLRPELAVVLRGPAAAPERTIDVSALIGWLALRSVDQQTKRLEAIEQGRPVDALQAPALQAPDDEGASVLPDSTPVPPPRRRKPPVPPQALQPLQPSALRPSALAPLPAPVDIKPAPGERQRGPQRVEGAPRGNPFPKPLGNPLPPQNFQPIFR